MEWTNDQRAAVEAPVSNLLVTAAAGSGKTQVLSGKILRRIEQGMDIDRILIITYTRAAAGEMRDRIGRQLHAAIEQHPENQHLRRQPSLLHNAKITTIHAFCLDVLKNYFFAVDIDPNFRLADQSETALMRYEAADLLMEELYNSEDAAFLEFVTRYKRPKSDDCVAELYMQLFDFINTMPFPEAWVQKALADMEQGTQAFAESVYGGFLLQSARRQARAASDYFYEAARMAEQDEKGAKAAEKLYLDGKAAGRLANSDSWNGFFHQCRALQLQDYRGTRIGDPATSAAVKTLREAARSLCKEAMEQIQYDEATCEAMMAEQKKATETLCRGALRFGEVFRELKADRGILDFSDLEHLALEILSTKTENGIEPSGYARELACQYDEIYIDEYQDTNLLQDTVFDLISRRWDTPAAPNIFMVGDMKQSIYRFRGASPELFRAKKEAYQADGPYRKIALSLNFRSRQTVVDTVNNVFETIMSEDCGEIAYEGSERLSAGFTGYTVKHPAFDKTEVHLLATKTKDETEEDITALQAEARLAAREIRRLMDDPTFQIFDAETKQTRPLQYKDVVILLRSVKNKAEIFAKELEQAGIPAFADASAGYFDALEVKVFLALLSVLDNPRQDIPLVGVMRSVLFGFSEDEIAQIRLDAPGGCLYDAVCASGLEKAVQMVAQIKAWRRRAATMPIHSLISYLLSETNWYAFAGALPDGTQRQANLDLLLERAAAFEKTSFHGLFHFLQFIEKTRQSSGDMGEAKLLGGQMNVVQIMSVHKSKGLEFPVVFLCGCGTRFNMRDLSGNLLLHAEGGIGLVGIDDARRIRYETPVREVIKKQINNAFLSEEMRVLYVALTRAREKLVITASVSDPEALCSPDHAVDTLQVAAKRRFIDWICMGGLHPQLYDVQVHSFSQLEAEQPPEAAPPKVATCPVPEHIRRNLAYTYAYTEHVYAPTKVSVSALKQRFGEADSMPDEIKTPRFLEGEKQQSPTARGTYIHGILQRLDFTQPALEPQLQAMQASLSPRDLQRLQWFWTSPLAQRMKQAKKVYKEVPFTMFAEGSTLSAGFPAGEQVMVQGVIDCFFEEEDGIVLVDYKTDRTNDRQVLRQRYETQLNLYARAIEKNFKKKCEKCIYLFEFCDIMEL